MAKRNILSKKYIKATCEGLCNTAIAKHVKRITDSESFRLGYSYGFEEGIKFAQSCKGATEPITSRPIEANPPAPWSAAPTFPTPTRTYTPPNRSPGDHRPLTNEEMFQSGEFTSSSDYR